MEDMESRWTTNVVWDDEENTSGEIYVSDPVGGKWKLYRKYKKQLEEIYKQNLENDIINAIS